jgi:YhcN/YlaJ family sporulation lipoprotein
MKKSFLWKGGYICLLTLALIGCSYARQESKNITPKNISPTKVKTDYQSNIHVPGPGTDQQKQATTTFRLADQVAKAAAKVRGVNNAAAVIYQKNAYIALDVKESYKGQLEQIKKKVQQAAKRVDPAIDRVYVSSDPKFFSQLMNFASDFKKGRPMSYMMTRIREMLSKAFPNAGI